MMKNIWKDWKNTVLFGAGILILALVLRLYNLTLLPIFGDEAIYVRWAQVMRTEPTLRFVPLSDGKQPLFMWSIIPFLKLFADPLFAGRMLSVVTGLGTLVGVFVLSFYLFNSKKTALIASLFYALSPFSIFFDRMALADSMLTMFGIWTLAFAVITVKTVRLDTAMLAGFALGGALLTKSPALFFVILLPSTWLVARWPKRKKGQAVGKPELIYLSKLVFLSLIVYLLGFGLYNILRLGPNFHMISARNQDYVFPISHLWTNPKDPFIFHFDRAIEWLWILGPTALLIFIILGGALNYKKNRKSVLLLAAWGLGPILVQSEFAKVFTARYIFFSIPPLMVLAASSFLPSFAKGVEGWFKEGRLKNILALGLIAFGLHSLYLDGLLLTNIESAPLPSGERSGYLEEWTAGTGIREVADFLRDEYRAEPDKKIVVGTEGYFGTLPDGLQIYLNDLPEITVIGIGINLKEIPESLIESKKAGNKTYLVINSTRLKAYPEDLGVELLAVYPKAFRTEGTKEYNTLGPRETLYFFEITEKAISSKSEKL